MSWLLRFLNELDILVIFEVKIYLPEASYCPYPSSHISQLTLEMIKIIVASLEFKSISSKYTVHECKTPDFQGKSFTERRSC